MRRLAATVLMFALGACGHRWDLKPKAGAGHARRALWPGARPTAEELLKVTSQAAPERSVELRKRSEERLQDPFDLPPSDE